VYNMVIRLFQCSNSRYKVDVYIIIKKKGDKEYAGLGNENIAV
jgi:hypothetical protein